MALDTCWLYTRLLVGFTCWHRILRRCDQLLAGCGLDLGIRACRDPSPDKSPLRPLCHHVRSKRLACRSNWREVLAHYALLVRRSCRLHHRCGNGKDRPAVLCYHHHGKSGEPCLIVWCLMANIPMSNRSLEYTAPSLWRWLGSATPCPDPPPSVLLLWPSLTLPLMPRVSTWAICKSFRIAMQRWQLGYDTNKGKQVPWWLCSTLHHRIQRKQCNDRTRNFLCSYIAYNSCQTKQEARTGNICWGCHQCATRTCSWTWVQVQAVNALCVFRIIASKWKAYERGYIYIPSLVTYSQLQYIGRDIHIILCIWVVNLDYCHQ